MTGSGKGGTSGDEDPAVACNIVAIFHASFHPTKGNIIDWSLKADDSVDIDGVEFSVLPSGLHLVERDVVYFSHGAHTGLAVFRRRPTRAATHRGFRLASLGVLLQSTPRPRPWLLAAPLRALADTMYAGAEAREVEQLSADSGPVLEADLLGLAAAPGGSTAGVGVVSAGDLTDEDFLLAGKWFERRRAEELTTSSGTWAGWSDELDGPYSSPEMPTQHLPHLLRILGLSALTLYKFVLARRRVLIFTLPPVEVAGVLAWVAADLCREHHMSPRSAALGVPVESLFDTSKSGMADDPPPESPRVLGMITLSDLERLEAESASGRGWIACTTDALFLERPQYYDLVIDLTTSTPSRASRPALHMSKPKPLPTAASSKANGKKRTGWRLETVRFTWSDVRLWTELDRILGLDSAQSASTCRHAGHQSGTGSGSGLNCCHLPAFPAAAAAPAKPGAGLLPSAWADAFRLYEDVCLLCATLWMGLGTWRSNSRQSFESAAVGGGGGSGGAWGAARGPGDDDWSLEGTHMRTLGRGIEGGGGGAKKAVLEGARVRSLGLGIEGRPGGGTGGSAASSTAKDVLSGAVCVECIDADESYGDSEREEERERARAQNVQTTLALLQTFHANTVFWLSKLREVLPPLSDSAISSPGAGGYRDEDGDGGEEEEDTEAEAELETVTITARDLLALELGVLSELDARFVEWLVEAEGYTHVGPDSARRGGAGGGRGRGRGRGRRRRRVVVKRGWQELFGIVFGLK